MPLSDREGENLDRRGAVFVPARPGSELARWLERGRADAVIGRPDMTVVRAGSPSELCKHVPVFTPPPLSPERPNDSAETKRAADV